MNYETLLAAAASYYRTVKSDLRLAKTTRNHAATLLSRVEEEREAIAKGKPALPCA